MNEDQNHLLGLLGAVAEAYRHGTGISKESDRVLDQVLADCGRAEVPAEMIIKVSGLDMEEVRDRMTRAHDNFIPACTANDFRQASEVLEHLYSTQRGHLQDQFIHRVSHMLTRMADGYDAQIAHIQKGRK